MLPKRQLFEPSPVDAPGTTFRSRNARIFARWCVQQPIPWAMVPQSAIGAIRPPRERSGQNDNQAEEQDQDSWLAPQEFD